MQGTAADGCGQGPLLSGGYFQPGGNGGDRTSRRCDALRGQSYLTSAHHSPAAGVPCRPTLQQINRLCWKLTFCTDSVHLSQCSKQIPDCIFRSDVTNRIKTSQRVSLTRSTLFCCGLITLGTFGHQLSRFVLTRISVCHQIRT